MQTENTLYLIFLGGFKMNKIQQIRKVEYDMSQKEFAEKLGISQNFLSYLESGQRRPSLKMVIKFSKILNVPIDSIVEK
jgi:transcriptional regulator with XRE-family HTH domain